MNMKKAGTFIIGFLVGILLIYLWGQLFNNKADTDITDFTITTESQEISNDDENSTDSTDKTSTITNTVGSDAIKVEDQKAGDIVQVSNINMPESGWVVIHEIKDGIIANALGASFVEMGENDNVSVYLLRNTTQAGEYAVILYGDDGDRQFSLTSDSPILDVNGDFIMSKFNTN